MLKRILFVAFAAALVLPPVPAAEAQAIPLPKPNAYKFVFWEYCIPGCPDMCECTIADPIIIT